ncbi:unnamed protein product [Moneuplotes crassus]|uniref:Myb-like domain-containing protein n=1 Tax=Euplotes crassus TaxID=5936 RepID=A0AAD1XGG5_EUPCR|nr:unnamed protein product [Moneuplotes crassus]
MNKSKYELKQQFSWTRKYNYGTWSVSEHDQFVSCLKTHGLNWPMLRQMIPTRTRKQIEAHLKGYFTQLKKHYGVEDPLQYTIAQNNEPLNKHNDKTNHNSDNELKASKPCQRSRIDQGYQSEADKRVPSSSHSKVEEQKHPTSQSKKRDTKYSEKLRESDDSAIIITKQKCVHKEVSVLKIVKKKGVTEVKEYMHPSRSNRKNYRSHSDISVPNNLENINDREPSDAKSYLMLGKGKGRIIISGTQIHTNTPCDVTTANSGTSLVIPNGSVNISIAKISQDSQFGPGIKQVSGLATSAEHQTDFSQGHRQFLDAKDTNMSSFMAKEDFLLTSVVNLLSQHYCFNDCESN